MEGFGSNFLCLCCLLVISVVIDGCGISTHVENGERASSYFNLVSEGVNYKLLLTRHTDALQAGAPYPDAFYNSQCFKGAYHGESEDTHWTPFINATVNYIRNQYPRPWDTATEKLVVFLLGVVTHQVADVTWHSLGIDQGFLDVMGKINFHGSFDDAHGVGDFGGDVLNHYELDMGYVGRIRKWYVPVDDLVNIYEQLYGNPDRMPREVIERCTLWLYAGRLGESIGAIDLLYPMYGRKSPFLLNSLNDYYLGGVDDMATWSANVWRRTVTMLDHGTQVCDLPNNPIYIRCNDERAPGTSRDIENGRHLFPAGRTRWDDESFATSISRVRLEDIAVRRTQRGIVYSASSQLQRKITARLKSANAASEDESPTEEEQARVTYNTRASYSRLGENLLSGDVNGDGYDDLVVSAPEFSTANNYQQGRVYIIYGSANGIPTKNLTLDNSANVVINGPLETNGRFGYATAILDFNLDGVNDLVVSAPSAGSQSLDYFGRVFVFLGDVETRTLSKTPSIVISCSERYCNLGWSLASGDMNNDGHKDLIIGSPFAPSGGSQRGMLAILYSSATHKAGDVLTEANFDKRFNGEQDYEWFAFSVNAAVVSTGETWLAAGSPSYRLCKQSDCEYDDSDVQAVGKVTVFRSGSGDSPAATLIGSGAQFEQFGSHVTVAIYDQQDVVIVTASAPIGAGGEPSFKDGSTGVVHFYRIVNDAIEAEPWISLQGDRQFDKFGSQVLVYQSHKDGNSHVIIAAPYRSESLRTDREGGRVYDYQHIEVESQQADITPNVARSRFGTSVAIIDSQGKQQLVIGAPYHTTTFVRLGGQLTIIDL